MSHAEYGGGPMRRCTTCTRSNSMLEGASSLARARELLNAARSDAEHGRERDCRRRVDRARALADPGGREAVSALGASILGLLELGQRSLSLAAEEFEQCARFVRGRPGEHRIAFGADYVEVLLAQRNRALAIEIAAFEQARSDRADSPELRASAARCRAQLADLHSFAVEFELALALQRPPAARFDLGRTHLLFGERLGRAGKRRRAREQLEAALAIFTALDRAPWVERARRELAAVTPTRRSPHDPSAADRLTQKETEVARLIAGGVTNREAAIHLFLSPKTIEAHLGHVYRKLGVHNRAQLVTALAREEDPGRP